MDCYKCCFDCKKICICLLMPVSFVCCKAKVIFFLWQYFDVYATLTPHNSNISFQNCLILFPVYLKHIKHIKSYTCPYNTDMS